MTMKQFTTAARRGEAAVSNPIDIHFEFEVREGEFLEMVAHPPTTGQLALFFAKQFDTGAAGVRALFDFLSWVLDDEDYELIENQLEEGLDVNVVIEIIQYLTAEWGARPTKQPSDSSPSRKSTGGRSTAKQRAAASTRSNSDSTAS